MRVRPPAVAGMFYEGSASRLKNQLEACFAVNPAVPQRQRFVAAVVPHAGLMYSGHVAAAFYAAAEIPSRLIILCPNHTGVGHFAAMYAGGAWRTPLGDVNVDRELAENLMSRSKLLRDDETAHAREHSLEVQLPLLQHVLASFTFVPICLGAPRYEMCEEIGCAIADVVSTSSSPVMILASSDLNHYEDQNTTLRKDQLVIEPIEAMRPRDLWGVVEEHEVSMCGYIPATTMLIAAGRLGASRGRLIKHATSGDVSGDYERVVGYAAVGIE